MSRNHPNVDWCIVTLWLTLEISPEFVKISRSCVCVLFETCLNAVGLNVAMFRSQRNAGWYIVADTGNLTRVCVGAFLLFYQ